MPQPYRSRLAWSVMHTWPSLSQRNAAPHCRDRASLSRAHNLAVKQCLAPLSRQIALCRDMENPIQGKTQSQHKILCRNIISLPNGKLYRNVRVLRCDIKTPAKAKLCRDLNPLHLGQLCCNVRVLCRDIKTLAKVKLCHDIK